MKLKMRPLHRMTYIALLAALAMMCMLLFGINFNLYFFLLSHCSLFYKLLF